MEGAEVGLKALETYPRSWLKARGIEYILGARERSDAEVREVVLTDRKPMVPVVVPRARGRETAIEVKEVVVGD